MFLHLSVILFTVGVSVTACITGHVTGGGLYPGGLCPGRVSATQALPPYGNERTVRILLQCILVLTVLMQKMDVYVKVNDVCSVGQGSMLCQGHHNICSKTSDIQPGQNIHVQVKT